MLVSCDSCPGFVPAGADRCPHCDAKVSRATESTLVRKLVGAAAAGAMMVTLMACYGDSSYGDDWQDCVDNFDCPSDSTCDVDTRRCVPNEVCTNGFDDDNDGLVDGADTEDCPSVAFEANCSDGFDDDADGDVDCADLDCSGDGACVENCNDDIDNDLDGLVDCEDIDCGVCPLTEVDCDDGQDDDEDGLVDCEDIDDCAVDCAPPVCGDLEVDAPETCDDGNVDPGDGCSPTCTHEPEFYCAAAETIEPNVVAVGTTAGGIDLFTGTCTGAGGPEARFQFTAPAAGTLYLTLDPTAELGLWVSSECPPVATLGCSDLPGTALDAVSVDVVADQTVFVFVDGFDPAGGDFELVSTFAPD